MLAVYTELDGNERLRRIEPLPRLYGPKANVPHPKIPAGGFQVTWTGKLLIPDDGTFTFTLQPSSLSNVAFTRRRQDGSLRPTIELEYGPASFRLSGRHRAGPPAARLHWQATYWMTNG